MYAADLLLHLVHPAVILCAAVAVVAVGRFAARRLRQPEVIGEIAAGLVAGPVAMRLLGPHRFHNLLPDHALADLKLVAQAGLVLFMVGLAHELRLGSARPTGRATGWVAAGSFLPALAAGGLLAGWVLLTGGTHLRGSAPTPAFVLMIAVSMSITAVPVLARILDDRGMTETEAGRVALSSAIVIDAVSWLMLVVAVGLRTGRLDGFLRSCGALAGGVAVAWLLRRALSTRTADRLCARFPGSAAVLLGAVAIAMARGMEEAGMTAILGAVLTGLAVPARRVAWTAAVVSVTRVGRILLPIFFVASGITVLTKALGAVPVTLVALTTVLGIAGKVLGGHVGARLGGYHRWDALRVGCLMNTRGLTELIVLQVGYSTGVLTPAVFLAFVVMALITTALTGPFLQLIDRTETRYRLTWRRRPTYAEGDAQ